MRCKQILAGCLAGMMLLLGACAQTPPPEQPPATTLQWYVNYSWFTTPWGGNAVSEAITEKTGVRVEFVVPSGSEAEKLDALIAADTLPDLITLGWWEPQVKTLVENGYVIALTEQARKTNPCFFEVANPTVLDWYRQSDGEVYAYPNSSFVPQDYIEKNTVASTQTFVVRKDLYEALGSPDMTTPEGFYNAVCRAAQQFGTVDGNKLIPLGVHEFNAQGCDSFGDYLMNFLAVPWEQNGAAYDRYTDPDYLAWLKMFARLGREGYLANDIFLDKRVQMEEKIAQGRYFCMLYQRTDFVEQQKTLYGKNPDKAYIAVDGPRNAKGQPHTLPGGGINGWTVTLVTKRCADAQKAMDLLCFLMSEEGQLLTSVGIENEDYTWQNGKAVFTPKTKQLLETDYAAYVATRGADNTYWMLQNNKMQARWRSESDPALSQMEQWAYPYTVYAGQYEVVYAPNSEADIIDRKIKAAWGQVLPQLLLSPSDEAFDKRMQAFLEKREAFGFAQLQQERTRQMQAQKARIGIS